MKTYTVNQLAQMAGISVRALHHYDEIGLLKPAFTGENRYRYYGEEELLRLQQIQAERYARMVKTIDRTIARLKGDRAMKDADLYSGVVSPEKQAEYEAWLVDRYGSAMEADIERSRKAMAEMSETERAEMMAGLKSIEDGLAEALRRGLPPQAAALDPMIERHRRWVAAAWGRDCAPQAYAGLADVYEHPDFRRRYEAIETGFADYLVTAMRAWAKRQAS
jgi:DNA-binding transcriptional MerR regulator